MTDDSSSDVPAAVPVAIALGSNLGDRYSHLAYAVARLRGILSDVSVSRFIDTAPVDVPGPQPTYLNGALTGKTTLSASDLLARLQSIETTLGRVRPFTNAARTVDLDLILYGDAVIDDADLQVPHPRFRERRFVLAPLAEVAPDAVDPVTGLTVRQLLDRLPRT